MVLKGMSRRSETSTTCGVLSEALRGYPSPENRATTVCLPSGSRRVVLNCPCASVDVSDDVGGVPDQLNRGRTYREVCGHTARARDIPITVRPGHRKGGR